MPGRYISLPSRLAEPGILVAPGVYDGLTASLAADAGFEAVYLSGASIAYTRFGRPDIGLVSMAEVADTLSVIRERVGLPIIVDADTGYGNALNVQRTVRLFERLGADAIQLEDQTLPKRCGHLRDKSLVPTAEMVGKLAAAIEAREATETLIIARTDALAVEGFDAACARADAYVDAGADILFIEAPRTVEEMHALADRFGGGIPLMANMVEGGTTPLMSANDLERIGFSLVIFPGGLVRALAATAQSYFASLRQHGTTAPYRDRMLDFAVLNGRLGTPELLAAGRRYAGETEEADE